jgi:voltage-gated potassium channel
MELSADPGSRVFRPAFFAAWLVISLAPWLSLPLANDHSGFGVREAAATTVAVLIAISLLVAVAGSHSDRGTFDRLLIVSSFVAGISAVPAAFAGAFYRMSAAHPSSFSEPLSKIDSLYLAVITFTTTGFRDIAPRSSGARWLVTLEIASALIVLSIAVGMVLRRLTRRSD